MKLHCKSFLATAALSILSVSAGAADWPNEAPSAQKMFMCTEDGKAQPALLAWTDAKQEIVAISALREDAEAPKFNDGMQRVSTHTNSKLYSVKPGYFVKSTGTETGGTLQVASSSYNCVPSYDD